MYRALLCFACLASSILSAEEVWVTRYQNTRRVPVLTEDQTIAIFTLRPKSVPGKLQIDEQNATLEISTLEYDLWGEDEHHFKYLFQFANSKGVTLFGEFLRHATERGRSLLLEIDPQSAQSTQIRNERYRFYHRFVFDMEDYPHVHLALYEEGLPQFAGSQDQFAAGMANLFNPSGFRDFSSFHDGVPIGLIWDELAGAEIHRLLKARLPLQHLEQHPHCDLARTLGLSGSAHLLRVRSLDEVGDLSTRKLDSIDVLG